MDGDQGTHVGDCVEDALLWEEFDGRPPLRGEDEKWSYESLYGLGIDAVREVEPSPPAIRAINRRRTIAAAPQLTGDETKGFFEMTGKLVDAYLGMGGGRRATAFKARTGELSQAVHDHAVEFRRLGGIVQERKGIDELGRLRSRTPIE